MLDAFDLEMSPVFEAYGKACYSAQMLESTLRFLLVLNKSSSEGEEELITSEALGSVKEETSKHTLNKIFRLAKEKENFTEREVSILIKANKDRNYLIHNFWDEQQNITLVASKEGKKELIKKLLDYAISLRKADKITVSLVDRYLNEHGFSTELLKEISPEILKQNIKKP